MTVDLWRLVVALVTASLVTLVMMGPVVRWLARIELVDERRPIGVSSSARRRKSLTISGTFTQLS